jgi:hypothetical protein
MDERVGNHGWVASKLIRLLTKEFYRAIQDRVAQID